MKALFVAGAHTDVGKTHVAAGLIRAARRAGLTVEALKPVVSDFNPMDPRGSDPERLLTALGRPVDDATLSAMSPWRFRAPLAPPMAAAAEGRALALEPVAAWCRAQIGASDADLVIVEGVGGLMSPITDDATGLDLMRSLALPAVMVGGTYLGAISHTLTALEVAAARGLTIAAVAVSESGEGAPPFGPTLVQVVRFGPPVPVVAVPRDADEAWADALLAAVSSEA